MSVARGGAGRDRRRPSLRRTIARQGGLGCACDRAPIRLHARAGHGRALGQGARRTIGRVLAHGSGEVLGRDPRRRRLNRPGIDGARAAEPCFGGRAVCHLGLRGGLAELGRRSLAGGLGVAGRRDVRKTGLVGGGLPGRSLAPVERRRRRAVRIDDRGQPGLERPLSGPAGARRRSRDLCPAGSLRCLHRACGRHRGRAGLGARLEARVWQPRPGFRRCRLGGEPGWVDSERGSHRHCGRHRDRQHAREQQGEGACRLAAACGARSAAGGGCGNG